MTEPTMLPPASTLMLPAVIPAMVATEDNWKGKTSPAERRKIQNKLNQRTWMTLLHPHLLTRPGSSIGQRRKQEKQQRQQQQQQLQQSLEAADDADASSSSSSSSSPPPAGALVPSSRSAAALPALAAHDRAGMQLSGQPRKAKDPRTCALRVTLSALAYLGRAARPLTELREEDLDDLYSLFLQRAHELRAGGRRSPPGAGAGCDPAADSLLPLVQFNLFRGLLDNSKTLGISLSMICDDDCVSPYASDPAFAAAARALPAALRPTRTQLAAAHHPWVDLLPLPRLRDNLIGAGPALDEDELCLDMLGTGSAPSDQEGGMILWGEPWDPRNWEVTEDFARRWRWLLEGCEELIASSNYWRAKRGERRMRVKL
ncbi:hypothetical protein LX36DRAFT_702300 [Colletotrichum falcatum]|nr:hypothetical protein LX36DRAFT_702300 [Colletotrichum falcatum]